jgi:large conductance mechanosensitive channel
MGTLKEFRDFALKGNVVDLAIAVIIGAAFAAIISSLVDDVITPLLLAPALRSIHAENIDQLAWGTVKYGKFLAAVIKFIMVAFILFLMIRGLNKMKRKEAVIASAAPAEDVILLREIRDELRKR